LGDARAAEKSRTAAETAYRQAAAVRPQDPTPYLRLTCLYLDWNRLNEGMAALGAAEEREADPREIAALRAFLYAARGDWEQAVAWAERALAQGDDRPTIRLLARGYLWLGREDAALAAYQALVEDDPDNPEFREHLGFLLALTDPSAALPHLRAASTPLSSDLIAALDEAPARRLARMGQIALARGEPALAARALERAVSQDPTSADARALLGHALALLGRSDAARTHLETAVREAPDSPLARSLLGLYYLRQGNFAAARPHLEAAYDLDPQNPALALYLASLYANLGEYAPPTSGWRRPLAWRRKTRPCGRRSPVSTWSVAQEIHAGWRPPGRWSAWRRSGERCAPCWGAHCFSPEILPVRKRSCGGRWSYHRTWPLPTPPWGAYMPSRAAGTWRTRSSSAPWTSTPTPSCGWK
jgi:tetratricopeptide (TPR) repeat protein